MAFIIVQCKTAITTSSQHKEDVENKQRTPLVLLFWRKARCHSDWVLPQTKQWETAIITKLNIKSEKSFLLTSSKIAQDFLSCLTGSGGGCKNDRQAHQFVSKCLKFLKSFEIVDLSLCSPNLRFDVVDMMQDEWKLGHAGYLDANLELGDFRKVRKVLGGGVSSIELYLKRVCKTGSKMLRSQWTSELDIDALEVKGHWVSLDELSEAVGRYLPRYECVLKSLEENPFQFHSSSAQAEVWLCFSDK